MAHQRPRDALSLVKKALSYSPVVGVVGQRQTGKTTLISTLDSEYTTLDLRPELDRADMDPIGYLEGRRHPFVIDECQKSPSLFPAIKEAVRKSPRPGRFLLSGSVRFTSRKAIRESLTGRILLIELLPMSLAETHSKRSIDPQSIQRANSEPRFSFKDWSSFMESGGMPGYCFKRKNRLRDRYFDDHFETILDRDLRSVLDTRQSHSTIRRVLVELALQHGRPLDYSSLVRTTRVSRKAIQALMGAFEALFLIRLIPGEGDRTAPLVYFEDVAELRSLAGNRLSDRQVWHQSFYQSIRNWFFYEQHSSFDFFKYETRGGALVELCVRSKNWTTGYIYCPGQTPGRSELQSGASFLKKYGSRSRIFIIGPGLDFGKLGGEMYTCLDRALL